MTNSNLIQSIKYPEINLEGTPTIIITKEFQEIVDYLHKKVGSIEWNGFIYSKIEGNIDKPNEMIITPKVFYLGGIGSAAYTEFKTDKAFFDFYMDRTEILEEDLKQGIFHTHHNMNVYHSSTDMKELHDNSHNYDFYVSLITNFKDEYDAKISFVVNMDKIATAKDKNSKPYKLKFKSDKALCIYNCKIVKEINEPVIAQYLIDRYAIVSTPKPVINNYSKNWDDSWDNSYNKWNNSDLKLPNNTKQLGMFNKKIKQNHLTNVQCGNIIADLFGYEEANFYNFLTLSDNKKLSFENYQEFEKYADEQIVDFIIEELSKLTPNLEVHINYKFKDEEVIKEALFEIANFVNEMESYYKRFAHYETIKKYINDYTAN